MLSNLRFFFLPFLWSFLLVFEFGSTYAQEARVPVLEYLGVLPVQHEGGGFAQSEGSGLQDASQAKAEASQMQSEMQSGGKGDKLQAMLDRSAQASERFRLLNSELVRLLWPTVAGRLELLSEYELDAYLSLVVSSSGDRVYLTLRLLDPKLTSLMLETRTFPSYDWRRLSDQSLEKHIRDLVFTLFNRLPVDAFVASVQGNLITLTAGSKRQIHQGARFTVERAVVTSVHPAHGSWLNFSRRPLGKVEIVEAEATSAVAQIIEQAYPNAIEVGDGIRFSAVPSRSRFAQPTSKSLYRDSKRQWVMDAREGDYAAPRLPVPLSADKKVQRTPAGGASGEMSDQTTALSPGSPKSIAPKNTTRKPSAQMAKAVEEQFTLPKPQASPRPSSTRRTAGQKDPDSPGMLEGNQGVADAMFGSEGDGAWLSTSGRMQARELLVHAGPWFWKASGPALASNSFPLVLVNRFGASYVEGLMANVVGQLDLDLSIGSVESEGNTSSFTGIDVQGRVLYEWPIDGFGRSWMYVQAGVSAAYRGLAVSESNFGGGDWLQFGVLGVTGGGLRLFEGDWMWLARLGLKPLALGRYGANGENQTIRSSIATSLEAELIQDTSAAKMAWGGGLSYAGASYFLESGTEAGLTEFSLYVLARLVL